MVDKQFRLAGPRIFSVEADAYSVDEHLTWQVGVAPSDEDYIETPSRFVIGTLHAHNSSGGGSVVVLGVISQLAGVVEGLDDLRGGPELELLYDFARPTLMSLLAVVGADVELPLKAPEAELSFLVKADDSADEDGSENIES